MNLCKCASWWIVDLLYLGCLAFCRLCLHYFAAQLALLQYVCHMRAIRAPCLPYVYHIYAHLFAFYAIYSNILLLCLLLCNIFALFMQFYLHCRSVFAIFCSNFLVLFAVSLRGRLSIWGCSPPCGSVICTLSLYCTDTIMWLVFITWC